jgi:hypothetical protein
MGRGMARWRISGHGQRAIATAAIAGCLLMVPPAMAQDSATRGPILPFRLATGGDPLPSVLRTRLHRASPSPQAEPGVPAEVKQSVGCVITGTTATAAAILAGGENLVNIIAGGVVAPQNSAILYIGLVGVVFASFCAIGQALTPLYLYYTEDAAPEPISRSGLSRTRLDVTPPPRQLTTASLTGRFTTDQREWQGAR